MLQPTYTLRVKLKKIEKTTNKLKSIFNPEVKKNVTYFHSNVRKLVSQYLST